MNTSMRFFARFVNVPTIALFCASCTTNATVSPDGSAASADTGATVDAGKDAIAPDAPSFTSDFVPPTGRATNAQPETPGEFRILTATSTDGVTFTRTNKVISDQANVPNVVSTPDGTIYLYYEGSGIESNKDTTAVAISTDGGNNWVYKKLVISALDKQPTPSDPDITLTADGTFHAFLTQGIGNLPAIRWATSTNGIDFTKGGMAFSHDKSPMDSQTFRDTDGTWWMHALQVKGEALLRAKSTDGQTFSFVEEVTPRIGNVNYFISCALREGDTLRLFAFNPGEGVIKTFKYVPPSTLTAEDGTRLGNGSAPLESSGIKDPAVTKLSNGTYFMAYATKIPL